MNEKTQKDVLAHLQAKDDALPAGTVLVPPATCPVCATAPCNALHHHFGTCPICHKTDGYLNVGNNHWFLCNTHKTKWAVGANLFSSCMYETPEQQRADQEKIGFDTYEKVEPYRLGVVNAVDDDCKDEDAEDMSDVKDVEFGDPKQMGADLEEELINFIAGYPYVSFQWICRKLNLTPAEALKRITPLVSTETNCCWTPEQALEAITSEANGEIERGWEPGIKPEPVTDEKLAELVEEHVRCQFNTSRNWSVADLAHRSGRDAKDVVAATIQMCMGQVLSHFKYTEFDPHCDEVKWLLSPQEIAEAVVNCNWIKTADRRITAGDFAVYKTDGCMGITYLEPEKEKEK
jgi:hypothetical protein